MEISVRIKSALEAMMYVWGGQLEIKAAAQVMGISEAEAEEHFEALRNDYEEGGRGLRVRKVGKTYGIVTGEENSDYIRRLCTPVRKRKLSSSALEVLAIVSYKQPVTRMEVESVRGIKCERVLEGLMNKGLIEERGRSDAIGRPVLYGTTDEFLKHFGLEEISQLPGIEDIEAIVEEDERVSGGMIRDQISMEELAKQT